MRALLALIRSEPALVAGVVSALVALAVSFGASLSTDQTGAIAAAVSAVLALVVRSAVTPNVAAPPPPLLPPKE